MVTIRDHIVTGEYYTNEIGLADGVEQVLLYTALLGGLHESENLVRSADDGLSEVQSLLLVGLSRATIKVIEAQIDSLKALKEEVRAWYA